MYYPEDFKNRVKKAFPTWHELHRLLDRGDPAVGKYLEESSHVALSTATSLEELEEKVKTGKQRATLYQDWYTFYEEQSPH